MEQTTAEQAIGLGPTAATQVRLTRLCLAAEGRWAFVIPGVLCAPKIVSAPHFRVCSTVASFRSFPSLLFLAAGITTAPGWLLSETTQGGR